MAPHRAFEMPCLHDVVRTGTVPRYPLSAHRDGAALPITYKGSAGAVRGVLG